MNNNLGSCPQPSHSTGGKYCVWWNDTNTVKRFICDLVAAEFAVLRPSGALLPALPWPLSTHLRDDLGADSLELLQIGTAVAEALHLHEAGTADYLLARPTIADWIAIAQEALHEFSLAITFRTSGSTGTAKSCSHTLDSLWEEALELASLLAPRRRILSAVPCHHIYGFIFTILLPHALAIHDIPVVDLRGSSAAWLAKLARDGDLIIAHPVYWEATAATMINLPDGVDGVTATAPCSDSVCSGLRTRGLNRLLQVFGSSETGGIGTRENESVPYTLFRHWHRVADSESELMRTASSGAVTRVSCPDKLVWCNERQFTAAGRVDAAVQVGGVNVYPTLIRQVLLGHPEIADASVRLMRSDEGNRLKAFVVPRDAEVNPIELQHRLAAWIAHRLTPPEQPKAFSFGAHCPTGTTGKAADWVI